MAGDGAENAARRRSRVSHNRRQVIDLSRSRKDWGFVTLAGGDPASPSVGMPEESDLLRPRRRGALSAYRNIPTRWLLALGNAAHLGGTASLALLSN
jgi:hypothetical protein